MKIAIIGSGGREHAIAWKLAQSNPSKDIFVLPGNGGTENNVAIPPMDFAAIKAFCLENEIELIFVGPEDPLAAGIVDYFLDTKIRVFGPDKKAAQLEGSKIWAKQFMKKHSVATADFWMPENIDDIRHIIQAKQGNVVIKFDGLAAGKGVFVCSSTEEAYQAIDIIHSRYGAGASFIIEEKLEGQELSIIGFTDGKDFKLLLPSQDHKPVYDGDTGPNTGGMGAYCPVPFCDEDLIARIEKDVVDPTLRGIQSKNLNYRGVIYFGLMITQDGPKLLEYNVRFGDPETEVLLPAIKSDLLELIIASLEGSLKNAKPQFNTGFFVDIVLASGGYPGSYEKGKEIQGLESVSDESVVFHAGTKSDSGKIKTSGGRVLNVVGSGPDLQTAIDNSYRECKKINFDKMFFRTDIGRKGLF